MEESHVRQQKTFRSVRTALDKALGHPKGNEARHLTTIAGMITGIVLGRGVQLPDVAAKIPDLSLPASREKKLYRCLKNEKITH